MQAALTIALMLVRVTGVLQLILGLLIWTEANLFYLRSPHIWLGIVFVLALWVLAALSMRAGIPLGLAGGVILGGLVVFILGMLQASLLPGTFHWVIQIVHVLIGMAAVGSGEVIGGRLKRVRMASAGT